jgi:hypothetical protein
MKKDKDADKTDKMDVTFLFNSVQRAHENQKVARDPHEKFKKSFPIWYTHKLS